MSRNVILSSVALLALSLGAQAADLPSKNSPVPAPLPAFSWAGFYAGVSAGAVRESTTFTAPYSFMSGTQRASGALAGVNAGYNWQSGSLVYGLEADIALAGASKTAAFSYGKYRRSSKLSGFGTLRARAGVAVTDTTLLYATGGLALGQLQTAFGCNTFWCGTAATSSLRVGWTLGAGVEYAVTPNWTIRAESLYAEFETGQRTWSTLKITTKPSAVLARGGVNYKF